jgi:hypothetical protein
VSDELILQSIDIQPDPVSMSLGDTEVLTVMGTYLSDEGETTYEITRAEDLYWSTSDPATVSLNTESDEPWPNVLDSIEAEALGDAIVSAWKFAEEDDVTGNRRYETDSINVSVTEEVIAEVLAVGKIIESAHSNTGDWTDSEEAVMDENAVVDEGATDFALRLPEGGTRTQLMLLPVMTERGLLGGDDALTGVSWTSGDPLVSVDADGIVETGTLAGSTEVEVAITASYYDAVQDLTIEDTFTVTVIPGAITGYTVVDQDGESTGVTQLVADIEVQWQAIGAQADGDEFILTEDSFWESSDELVAVAYTSAGNRGGIAPLAEGDASVTATWGLLDDSKALHVNDEQITDVSFSSGAGDQTVEVSVLELETTFVNVTDYNTVDLSFLSGTVLEDVNSANPGLNFTIDLSAYPEGQSCVVPEYDSSGNLLQLIVYGVIWEFPFITADCDGVTADIEVCLDSECDSATITIEVIPSLPSP